MEAYRAKLSDLANICAGIDQSLEKLELQALEKHIEEHPEEIAGIPGIQKLIKTMANEVIADLFGEGKKLPRDIRKRLDKVLDKKGGKEKPQGTDEIPPKK